MASDNVHTELLQRRIESQAVELERLKSGGGGGTFDGMETRVTRLEDGMSDIKKSLGGIEKTLAILDERTKHFPTRWEAFLIFCAVVAAVGGIIALTTRFVSP